MIKLSLDYVIGMVIIVAVFIVLLQFVPGMAEALKERMVEAVNVGEIRL